jgi:hypothetical protein
VTYLDRWRVPGAQGLKAIIPPARREITTPCLFQFLHAHGGLSKSAIIDVDDVPSSTTLQPIGESKHRRISIASGWMADDDPVEWSSSERYEDTPRPLSQTFFLVSYTVVRYLLVRVENDQPCLGQSWSAQ